MVTHQMHLSKQGSKHKIVKISRDNCVYFKAHRSPLNEEINSHLQLHTDLSLKGFEGNLLLK